MKLAALVILVTGAGAGYWYLAPGSDPEDEGAKGTHVVRRQSLKITLTERGTLKAKSSTLIRAETHAKLAWMVEEGSSVKEGDILIKLDKTDAGQRLEQYVSQITQLEAELKSATTEEQIQVDQNKTDFEKSRLTLEIARVEHTKLIKNDIPSEVRKKELAIAKADTAVAREKDKLQANEQLLQEDFVTVNDVKEAKLRLREAQDNLLTAKMELQSYDDYTRPLEIRKKESAVTEAERGLERTKKKGEAQLVAKNARVQQKQLSLTRTKQRHKKQAETLEKMSIKAPTDGTALIGDPNNPWNNRNIKVGAQVWRRMILMTLPDLSEMTVVVHIHEADISQVRVGMTALVTSETKKNAIFNGKVSKIDPVANAGQRNFGGGNNVKRFKVEVLLEGKHLELKTGTSARVELQIGAVEDVLAIPVQAVQIVEGKQFCYRLSNGEPERVVVESGRSNDTMVEIKSGLEEGDRIVLYAPGAAESSAPEESKGE